MEPLKNVVPRERASMEEGVGKEGEGNERVNCIGTGTMKRNASEIKEAKRGGFPVQVYGRKK